MITLIIGTPDSGKSALAEKLSVERYKEKTDDCSNKRLIYLATMIVYDAAGEQRIAKHRKQRKGKGFVTIEKPFAIQDIIGDLSENDTVLLECITNLVGNELYENAGRYRRCVSGEITDSLQQSSSRSANSIRNTDMDDFVEKITSDIKLLTENVSDTVIVTNVFDLDASCYDEETLFYMRAVNLVNESLSNLADEVIRV